MKYLSIKFKNVKIKGDEDDLETLGEDVCEKIQAMAEARTLDWEIDWEAEEEDDDF